MTRTAWRLPISTLTLAAAVIAAGLLTLSGALSPLDQSLRSARFHATDRAPSGQTVFLDIDSTSLAAVGVWPWPRQTHAQILDRLMAMGAADVVFDIDFSSASTPQGDAALEGALERAGGYAFLAAFQQMGQDQEITLNRPLPRFSAHADAVVVNVDGDGTSLLRSVPAALPEFGMNSLAKALVPEAETGDAASLLIDFGIDLSRVVRVSAAEVLFGQPDPVLFANRQVVIGASAIELRDFFRVPRFGVIPGPMAQIAAVETLRSGRTLTDIGSLAAMLLTGLALLVYLPFRHRPLNLAFLALGATTASLIVEAAAWLAQLKAGILMDTAGFQLFIVLLSASILLTERAMRLRDYLKQQARLAYLAGHDPSTGAISRQALLDTLDPVLAGGGTANLVLVHLGRLDRAIASLGHDIGEQTARQAVERVQAQTGVTPARIGLDLLSWPLLPGLDAAAMDQQCRRISAALELPYAVDGHEIFLETRFGTSASRSGVTAGELLRQADVALTSARAQALKALPYGDDQGARIVRRRLHDIALRHALERDEFHLLFQPQVDLRNSAVLGLEALVRWTNDSLGDVSPAEFIPLAEETDLIVDLGDWVLNEACRQAAGWSAQVRLSVNVSSAQFLFGDVVASVRRALTASGFPAHRLDLEITESLFVKEGSGVIESLTALRAMGVSIALDDFGTGYSSLSYLARLPIDKLKIDQAFVRPLPQPQNEALVETIILMAKRLGKTVVAEGIETEVQRDYLASLGCQVGQGYLFGRPSTALKLGLERQTTRAA